MPMDRKAYDAWKLKNITRFEFPLNNTKDADVIEMLSLQKNRRQYLLGLIRKDIAEKQAIIDKRKEEKKKSVG